MGKNILLSVLVGAFLVLGFNQEARAAFPEKDIQFVIPFGPGGGFDTYVRAVAPVMEKHLPNKVNIIPKNVGGAGGRKGTNFTYRAKPDGYTIGIINLMGVALSQIIGDKIEYDLYKMAWLGRISTDYYGIAVSSKSKFKTLQDLKNLGRPIKYPSTGVGSGMYVVANIANEALKLDSQYITGYKTIVTAAVGVIRNDGDAIISVLGSLNKLIRGGELRLLGVFNERHDYPGVPTASQLGAPDLASLTLDRMVVGPPGIPGEVKKVLETALLKALADPELSAWSKKSRKNIDPYTGEEADAAFQKQMKFLTQYKELFKK